MAKILVVDDDDAVRRLIAKWLQADGHEVVEAANGRAAIDVARKRLLDLIIMDINLPDMTGFSATEGIRSFRELATIPIICLTGLDMGIAAAHEGGCTDLVLKPVARDELLAVVKRHYKHAN